MRPLAGVVLATIASLSLTSSALAFDGNGRGRFSGGRDRVSHHHKSSPRVEIGFGIGPIEFGYSNVRRIPVPRPYCPPQRVFAPGHYETRCETVRLPGHYEDVWVEPVYERHVDHCGTVTEVLVRAGYHKRVWIDGGYETREVRVWVPGCYR